MHNTNLELRRWPCKKSQRSCKKIGGTIAACVPMFTSAILGGPAFAHRETRCVEELPEESAVFDDI